MRRQFFLSGENPAIERISDIKAADKAVFGIASSKPEKVRQLRIIQVFNRYLNPGGEEKSVVRIAEDLEAGGHQVIRFWKSSEDWLQASAPPRWKQPFLMLKNPTVLAELRALQEKEKADLWIFHNVVPVISLSVYELAKEMDVPVFQWLHNYRPISPSGTLTAGDELLRADDPWLAWKETWRGNWHGSLLTGWLAFGYSRLKSRGDFSAVRAWIAISNEVRNIFLQAGWSKEQVFTLRHCWHLQPAPQADRDDGYFLFLGRMVETKGVRFLVELWNDPRLKNVSLVMAGQGPLKEELENKAPKNIRWVGHVEGETKDKLVAGCRGILFPVVWSEPLGTVAYEAYQMKKPILASNLGGIKEIVEDERTGRLLNPADREQWISTILSLTSEEARRMGANGRKWLEQNAGTERWIQQFNAMVKKTLG
jgi:glycosyltransferase involved in cell wall biosynthesis